MTENFTAFTHRATSREQLESYSRLDTDHVRLCGLISIARNYVIERAIADLQYRSHVDRTRILVYLATCSSNVELYHIEHSE